MSEKHGNTLDELEPMIYKWFQDKQLNDKDPRFQFIKGIEEIGELASALFRYETNPEKYHAQAKDAIGDVMVVMFGLAWQLGLTPEDCLQCAYDEIKDRVGIQTENGFVKEEDCLDEDGFIFVPTVTG